MPVKYNYLNKITGMDIFFTGYQTLEFIKRIYYNVQ